MARKKIDGISAAIAVVNVLIVGVIITLCVLIYLYMSGKLEQTNVSNLGSQTETGEITTTPVSMATIETTATPPDASETSETSDTEETAEEFVRTDDEGDDSGMITAVETDSYDSEFFEKDLFIGDSIYTGLLNYGFMEKHQVFAAIGLSPSSALTHEIDGQTCIQRAEALKPKRIFIMLGSNGLAYLGNTTMADSMGELAEKLREASPESYIYILSIPPVTKDHEAKGQETMAMVNGYNKLLKDKADDIGVVYLDLCSELKNTSGYFSDAYAEADGMHFLGAAYRKMLAFLQRSTEVS